MKVKLVPTDPLDDRDRGAMRIAELSRRTGLAPSALRHYEDCDLFSPGQVERLPNGYRDYSEEAVRRVQLIQIGRAVGFGLVEMRERMANWDDAMSDHEKASILREQQSRIDARMTELRAARRAIREVLAELDERRQR